MKADFWRGRRVFLTGHTGFKGSWLAIWLNRLGAEVTGFGLEPNGHPSLYEAADVAGLQQSIIGDVRDAQALANAISASKPEIVLHLAAQAFVLDSYRDPVGTYATNIMGSVHLYEAVRACSSVKAVVNVTTDKCYENQEWVWGYRETDPMGGYDPYSSSKGCVELVSAAYRRSFFSDASLEVNRVALATARAGNVIGGGDWSPNRLVPDIISAIHNGAELKIRSPNAIRPWQHVLEPLRGYLTLAEKLFIHGRVYADGWNFGPEDCDARPVSWIADALVSRLGGRGWSSPATTSPHEAGFLKLDISKARQGLGWSPALKLTDALDLVADWNKRYQRGEDCRSVTLDQIEQYERIALS